MRSLVSDIECEVRELRLLADALSDCADSDLKPVMLRVIGRIREDLERLAVEVDNKENPKNKENIQENNKESEELPVQEQTVASTPLRSLFSLNDFFLFSREFFGGDTQAFSDWLERLSSVGSVAEAEMALCALPEAESGPEVLDELSGLVKRYFSNKQTE